MARSDDRLHTSRNARLGSVFHEIAFTVAAVETTVSSLSYLDSLGLRHHACSFCRTSRRLSFRLQLRRLFCCEFGPFAPRCFEFRGIPQLLLALAPEKGTSENRPGFSLHGLRILIHLSECSRWNPHRRQRSRLLGCESRSRGHPATSHQ